MELVPGFLRAPFTPAALASPATTGTWAPGHWPPCGHAADCTRCLCPLFLSGASCVSVQRCTPTSAARLRKSIVKAEKMVKAKRRGVATEKFASVPRKSQIPRQNMSTSFFASNIANSSKNGHSQQIRYHCWCLFGGLRLVYFCS